MRIKAVFIGASAILVGLAVSGCSDSDDVTLHRAGVYKGPVDPLVEKQRSSEQQETLLARFKQVQTDRDGVDMDIRGIHLMAALLVVAALVGSGCSSPEDTGPYSTAKQDWDSARSGVQLDGMRMRLATTQQDH